MCRQFSKVLAKSKMSQPKLSFLISNLNVYRCQVIHTNVYIIQDLTNLIVGVGPHFVR